MNRFNHIPVIDTGWQMNMALPMNLTGQSKLIHEERHELKAMALQCLPPA